MTELEGTVLGVVRSKEPCTPYQVRREFAGSPSLHWSASAGAIYPLMNRLARAGFLRSEAHATGSRKSRLYRLTPAGRKALADWLEPERTGILSVPPDPLRMRMAFLDILPESRRASFLAGIEDGLAGHLLLLERDYAERRESDPSADILAPGAIAMQKARLEWIRRIRKTGDGGRASKPRPR